MFYYQFSKSNYITKTMLKSRFKMYLYKCEYHHLDYGLLNCVTRTPWGYSKFFKGTSLANKPNVIKTLDHSDNIIKSKKNMNIFILEWLVLIICSCTVLTAPDSPPVELKTKQVS